MVVFTCHGCNETLKKAQVEKHRMRCNRSHALCCIDCLKDFHGEEFQAHTKCISENQKYGGQNYVAKENKGEVKQQKWFDTVQQAIDIASATHDNKLKQFLSRLRGFPNIPQKEAKFHNFVSNCVKERDHGLVARAWAAVVSAAADLKKKDAEKASKLPKSDGSDTKESALGEDDKTEDISKQKEKEAERSGLPETETNAEVKPKNHKKHKKEKMEDVIENIAEPDVSKEAVPEAELRISCDDAVAYKSEENGNVKPKKNKKSKKEKEDESEQITKSSALSDIDTICNAKLDIETSRVEGSNVESKIQRKKDKKHKNRLEENGAENHEAAYGNTKEDTCNGDVLESETNIGCDKSDQDVEIRGKKHKKRKRQSENEANTCRIAETEISSKDACDSPKKRKQNGQVDHCENESVTVQHDEAKPKSHKKHKKVRTDDN